MTVGVSGKLFVMSGIHCDGNFYENNYLQTYQYFTPKSENFLKSEVLTASKLFQTVDTKSYHECIKAMTFETVIHSLKTLVLFYLSIK